MYLLVSGATATMKRFECHPNLGVLLVPRDGNALPPHGVVWAADNGCFTGFDEALFRVFLKKLASATASRARWVAAPDVVNRTEHWGIVGDAEGTAKRWRTWAPIIRAHGLPPAFVCQDGLVADEVPWDEAAAIFIGGSDRFKLGEEAVRIIAEAQRRGLWVHMGRVGTERRILYAAALQVTSIDCSKFSRWSDTHIPGALALFDRLRIQRRLPVGVGA